MKMMQGETVQLIIRGNQKCCTFLSVIDDYNSRLPLELEEVAELNTSWTRVRRIQRNMGRHLTETLKES